jgi:hypothetical protein
MMEVVINTSDNKIGEENCSLNLQTINMYKMLSSKLVKMRPPSKEDPIFRFLNIVQALHFSISLTSSLLYRDFITINIRRSPIVQARWLTFAHFIPIRFFYQ